MRHNQRMRDRVTKSTSTSAEVGTGMLLVTGFSGNPTVIKKLILDSRHVQNVEFRRSGSQVEFTLELSKTVTPNLLREIVKQFQDFNATIQGFQSSPVPTLVFSLTPAKKRRRGFLRRSLRKKSASREKRPTPTIPVTQPKPVASQYPLARTHAETYTRPTPVVSDAEPELTNQIPPGPIASAARSAGRTVRRSTTAKLRQVTSIIWRTMRETSSFTARLLVELTTLMIRSIRQLTTALPPAITRVSILITAAGNYLFGTGSEDDFDSKLPDTTSADNGQNKPD